MPIRFLNVPGSDNLRTSRPAGYKFPVGIGTVINTTSNNLITTSYLWKFTLEIRFY